MDSDKVKVGDPTSADDRQQSNASDFKSEVQKTWDDTNDMERSLSVLDDVRSAMAKGIRSRGSFCRHKEGCASMKWFQQKRRGDR